MILHLISMNGGTLFLICKLDESATGNDFTLDFYEWGNPVSDF